MGIVKISINRIMDIVNNGGFVKTGVDIYSANGSILLAGDVLINKIGTILILKNNGVLNVSVDPGQGGDVWDKNGNRTLQHYAGSEHNKSLSGFTRFSVEKKIRQLSDQKEEASEKYRKAKNNIKKVIDDIKNMGGEFDHALVQETVTELFDFITKKDSMFTYLVKDIFSYDDYLYNHCINVCTIGSAVLDYFNDHFGAAVNTYLSTFSYGNIEKKTNNAEKSFVYYSPEEMYQMAIGFFLHDVGKVLIPESILLKKGKLSREEFEIVKTHSFSKGIEILERNHIESIFITNVVKFHHAPLYLGDDRGYPDTKFPVEIPAYVKICKLVDIYDAMTSKRCYKDALHPMEAASSLFHEYANKDRFFQFVVHAFFKVVGIYPPGSVVFLRNGQAGCVIDSEGPIIIPITDKHGNPLVEKPDPIDIGGLDMTDDPLQIDKRRPLASPAEVYNMLPSYLKTLLIGVIKTDN